MEFVVAAYAVIWFGLVMYMVLLGARTARLGRDLELLARVVDSERSGERTTPDP